MPTILVLNGSNQGEWYTLGEHAIVFGRDEELLAELADPRVSQRHLEVRYDFGSDHCYATDLGSRNGVTLNDEPVRESAILNEGDLLRIGHTLLAFTQAQFDDEDQAQAHVDQARAQHRERLAAIADREQQRAAPSPPPSFLSRILDKLNLNKPG